MLSFRNCLSISRVLASLLCAVLYGLGSDFSYSDWRDTLKEASIIAVMLFALILAFTWLFRKRERG
ncbi:MAG: hypothetical protein EOP52_08455 [Sphingobacteriales bacterium]|nr:MAG: hypothetical protein EOP52_08455 [Sphingobacteriales bacterium]